MKNIDINEETETVQKIITNFSDMKFTLIPADEFVMGSEETDEEKPVHKVTLSKRQSHGWMFRDLLGHSMI